MSASEGPCAADLITAMFQWEPADFEHLCRETHLVNARGDFHGFQFLYNGYDVTSATFALVGNSLASPLSEAGCAASR